MPINYHMKLIREGLRAPNGFPTLDTRLLCSVASLDHESSDIAMEEGSVIGTVGTESKEIEGRSRSCVAEDFQLEISDARVQCNRHFLQKRAQCTDDTVLV